MELIGCLFDGFAVVVRVHFNQLAHFVEARPESHSQLIQSEFNVGARTSRRSVDSPKGSVVVMRVTFLWL